MPFIAYIAPFIPFIAMLPPSIAAMWVASRWLKSRSGGSEVRTELAALHDEVAALRQVASPKLRRSELAACTALVLLAGCRVAPAPAVQDGDIIFQTSRSSQSLAIQRATHSPYSHMGLVLYRDGRAFVLEAVATVRYTPLAEWIDRGVGRHFVVRRLRDWPE